MWGMLSCLPAPLFSVRNEQYCDFAHCLTVDYGFYTSPSYLKAFSLSSNTSSHHNILSPFLIKTGASLFSKTDRFPHHLLD